MSYAIQRIAFSILSLFFLLFVTFLLSNVMAGDPAIVAAGPNAGAAKIEALRVKMGLDQPIFVQFIIYCGNILRGDLGVSWFTQQPIASDLLRELPPSLELVLVAMVINLAISLPLGLLTARFVHSKFDDTVRLLVMAGAGLPVFWVAILLQQFVAGAWGLFPIAGRLSFANRGFSGPTGFHLIDSLMAGNIPVFLDTLNHLVLPAFALSLLFTAVGVRITRTSMINEFRKDYVTLARAKRAIGLVAPA